VSQISIRYKGFFVNPATHLIVPINEHQYLILNFYTVEKRSRRFSVSMLAELFHITAAHLTNTSMNDDFIDCSYSNKNVYYPGNKHALSTEQHAYFPPKKTQ
jgi:hypothetical protein